MTPITTGRCAAVIALGLAAGCSGGGSEPVVVTPGAYNDAELAFQDVKDAYESFTAAGLVLTSPSALPGSGTALYRGRVSADDGTAYGLSGEIEVTANWGCCEVTGRVFNLVSKDDELLSGEFAITHGEILMDDPRTEPNIITADLIGTLTGSTGQHESDEFVPLQLEGNFVGDNFEWMAGTLSGPVTAPDGTHDLSGDFYAEQQP